MSENGRSDLPLFEDRWNCQFHRQLYAILGCTSLFIGGFIAFLFLVVIPFGGGYRGRRQFLSVILIMFGVFLLSLRTIYHPIRILKDGLSFTVPVQHHFLPFDQVDFITKADLERVNIYRKAPGDVPLSIASVASGIKADDRIRDWSRFYNTLKACLMSAQPDKSESYLVRDYQEVEWAPEALGVLENRRGLKWDQSRVARWTNEEVLKQDRRLVELADIQGYLK